MGANGFKRKETSPNHLSKTIGCMLGGAVGNALGAPVEFLDIDEICDRYGTPGITRLEEAYGRIGAITDDTQMSLFTAEGLILSTVRREYAEFRLTIPAIYHANLRWLYTQETQIQAQLIKSHGTCSVVDGILTGHKALFSKRSPDETCLAALRSGQMGTLDQPINQSKGCGGVMRAAPIGLAFADPEEAFLRGCESAAITHGHPTGYLAAGCFASLISRILSGASLVDAISDTIPLLKAHKNFEDCLNSIEAAVSLSSSSEITPEDIKTLGGGWIAEEALAIGICCALTADDDFRRCVLMAVNHSGDSDSTGSLAGNLLGVQYGMETLPDDWLSGLEMKDVITEVASDLADTFADN